MQHEVVGRRALDADVNGLAWKRATLHRRTVFATASTISRSAGPGRAVLVPPWRLNARIAARQASCDRAGACPGGLQLRELAVLAQCLNHGIDGIAEIGPLPGISNPEALTSRHFHCDYKVRSLAREP